MSTTRPRSNAPGLGSLGTRLLLAFALVAVSSVLVLTGAALIGVDRGVQAGQQADHQQVADATAAAAAAAYESAGGWAGADLTRAMGAGDAASARVVILDATGATVASTGPGMGSGGMGMGMNSEAVVVPVVVNDTQVGSVRVAFPTMTTSRVLDVAWSWIIIAAIVALVVAFAVSWFVTRLLVGPMRTMTEAARLFTAGDRQSRATVRAPGELWDLAVAFNGMADEVVRSDQNRRNLTADVAHELRTPLAALQAGLEELRDGLAEPTTESLAGLHDQSLRLGRVVADLAELSAVETAGPALHVALVDLAHVAVGELSLHEPHLRAAGLKTVVNIAGPIIVRADSDRLHQAIGNLIANAIRYCRSGDTVTVTLTAEVDRAVLRIADNGPGIPPDELPHIFERLWRGRAAQRIPGSGIGLALVREIITKHGGTVEAVSTQGEGTTLTVRLPIAGVDTE
ncbi:MAG: HAMP domain-containing histidine kinase [Salinibacterium sp.]|nr:HAMP domain-containing histidine kinase [Salinibacterium sp.]